jgi:hypothetical protein
MATTHYAHGISDRPKNHPMGALPVFDPTKHYMFHDDFNSFVTAAAGITGWHKDEVNAGTDPIVQDAFGGVILFVIDNADNDNQHYQWATNATVHEPVRLTVGKQAWLRVKFKVEDADKDLPMIGCHVAADDPWGTEPTDQFLFRVNRTALGALQFACGKTASTEVTVAMGDLADDTWVTCTAWYDGRDTVSVYREDASGNVTFTGSVSVTSAVRGDLLPDTEMGISFGMEATDTGADDMHVDFITVIVER